MADNEGSKRGQALNIAKDLALKKYEDVEDVNSIIEYIYETAEKFLDVGRKRGYWSEEKPEWKKCSCGAYVNVRKFDKCKNGHNIIP